MEFVGRTVTKDFNGFGVFSGIVESYDSATGLFKIVYEDGDSEELELSEIGSLVEGMKVDQQPLPAELSKRPSRAGRKPKKRRRVEIRGDSGNDSTHLVSSSSCVNDSSEVIRKNTDDVIQQGFPEIIGNECELGEDVKETLCNKIDLNSNSNDALDLNDELNSNDCLSETVGFDLNCNYKDNSERSTCIDLNVDLTVDCSDDLKGSSNSGIPVVENQKRELSFDLNLGLDDGVRYSDADYNEHVKEEIQKQVAGGVQEISVKCGKHSATETSMGVCSEVNAVEGNYGSVENVLEDSCKRLVEGLTKENGLSTEGLMGSISLGGMDARYVTDCMSPDVQVKEGLSDAGASVDHGYLDDSGSTHRGRNRRKRRKVLDSETVLRRSTRRVTANVSAPNHVPVAKLSSADLQSSSPAVSAVSEEKPILSGCEEFEEEIVLPPKVQLPPSSENLNLDGIPVLDLFCVYACLRSFSTLLFLSPFRLEDFVAALKCKVPTVLFDSIHVSLLQTLRKHLESLSDENIQSASNCLRSLNWDLLDLITWPMFMVEYLLMHGSGVQTFDPCRLRVIETDYYKQPASVKIEIIRCLCDDVIEVEAITSELGRRMVAAELCGDSDRFVKMDTSKKRKARMDVSGGSCFIEEVVDETADWNSDECCLCKMDGSLICCDGCPAAYHSRCVGVATSLLPEGDWYCPECAIDKDNPWLKLGKSLRGAELLGRDPHGRLYYSSCGYLLVSDSCDTESSFSYYNINDLPAVTEALRSSDFCYIAILGAINKHWGIRDFRGDMVPFKLTSYSDFLRKRQVSATPVPSLLLAHSETSVKDENIYEQKPEDNSIVAQHSGNISCEVSELVNIEPVAASKNVKMENILTSSEGSVDISQTITGIQNHQKAKLDSMRSSSGTLSDFRIPNKFVSVGDCSLTSTNLDIGQSKNIQSANCSQVSAKVNERKGDASQGQCGSDYVNYYNFARTASSVAEELARKSSDKTIEDPTRSVEEIILSQLKSISKNSTKLWWPNIQNIGFDARREKCGWCFSCKVPDEDRDCLFNMCDTCPAPEGFSAELVSICSKRNRKGHLIDLMCHILCTEERLRGLLGGPWLNPHYTKLWRKNLLKASDLTSVKKLFLKLESNLHHLALSPEWLKHVDSVATMGSSSHIVTKLRMSSKTGIVRKRARCLDPESNTSSSSSSGLGLFWWRGGRISRQLFNWKVLPHSIVSRAARRAGCMKIPGILYPDGSEFAKRSKYVAWRAAVETSRSVEQLALQVREFDSHIRWDEIEKTNHLSMMEKLSKKPIKSFKKVIIRRKCTEGTVIKYLLDFGKRRFIPDIVLKHGNIVEDSSSARKKYWLEESYVPLHLLKVYEEKRIAMKSNKMGSGKRETVRSPKKPSKKKGFSYLFSKAASSENYQCGHCNKDVPIGEAVSCQFCEGFFHKRHVKKSTGSLTAKCAYTCHKCKDGKSTKIETKQGKSQLRRGKNSSIAGRIMRSSNTKKVGKNKRTAHLQNKSKNAAAVPLRRSARKLKCVSLQNKKPVGRKKGKQIKSKKEPSKKTKKVTWQNKRTKMYHSYWLSGLLLSRKPNDERVMNFRSKKLLVSCEQFSSTANEPKCSLCCEPEFTSKLSYIGCEICGDWFHGDAFGLNVGNIGCLIGFKCHKCRNRIPPSCPHLHVNAELDKTKLNAGIECSEEVSHLSVLPNEVHVEEKPNSDEESKKSVVIDDSCHNEQHAEPSPNVNQKTALDVLVEEKPNSDEESKQLVAIDESCHNEQHAEPSPNVNQKIALDAENSHLDISKEAGKEAYLNTDENDRRLDVSDSRENISLEDRKIDPGSGHVAVSALVGEEPLFKSDENT